MKLTTKLALIYLAVTVVLGAGFGFFGIPYIKSSLENRERNYAVSFLERESQIIRTKVKKLEQERLEKGYSEAEFAAARREFFEDLETTFGKFYFHNSGRLFVIDKKGTIVVSSDPTKNGRTVSNLWIYQDGRRNRLIQDMTSTDGNPQPVRQFSVQDFNEAHDRVTKSLFVSEVAGTRFLICISVDEAELYYSADWISRASILTLAIIILLLYLLFHVFYTGLRKRFDTIIEHAELVADGNYEVTIGDAAEDEVGILARTIDHLAENLRQQKSLENQLRQVQKMEMVGTLASGIAHDFNNTLGGIMSGLELVEQEIRAPADKQSADLELIEKTIRVISDCANRGKETVEQLLSFSRKRETEQQLIDLNRCVKNVEEICQHSFDKRIRLTVKLPSERSVVLADRSHLEQAILNVCINARDAMDGGGEVTMTVTQNLQATRPRRDNTETITCHCIEIRDTGGGMPPETLAKVFEPFFTTKQSGTGMGLAMVYKAIDDLGGWVDVDSREGQGTTFRIYLPAAQGEVEEPGNAPRPAPSSTAVIDAAPSGKSLSRSDGKESILIVDDDTFMLQMTRDILERLGYQVETAEDGKAGIEVFAREAERLNMVVLDLMLPELSGDEVFDAMREQRPDIPVLLISGHKRDPRIADLLARGCDGFLNKPYSIEELSEAVRQILDRTKQMDSELQ